MFLAESKIFCGRCGCLPLCQNSLILTSNKLSTEARVFGLSQFVVLFLLFSSLQFLLVYITKTEPSRKTDFGKSIANVSLYLMPQKFCIKMSTLG